MVCAGRLQQRDGFGDGTTLGYSIAVQKSIQRCRRSGPRPFGLSLSKPPVPSEVKRSISKPCIIGRPFIRLRANRVGCMNGTGFRSGKLLNTIPVTGNQGFFPGARPALNLLFKSYGLFTRFELALPDQLNRFACCGIPVVTVMVLLHTGFQIIRVATVVGAISTLEQIDMERFHGRICIKASTGSAQTVSKLKKSNSQFTSMQP